MLITKLRYVDTKPSIVESKSFIKDKTTKHKMKNFNVIPKTVHMFLLTKPEANTAKTDSILRLKYQFCCPNDEIKAST